MTRQYSRGLTADVDLPEHFAFVEIFGQVKNVSSCSIFNVNSTIPIDLPDFSDRCLNCTGRLRLQDWTLAGGVLG